MNLYPLEFTGSAKGKMRRKKGSQRGRFFSIPYVREHGETLLEGEFLTDRRHRVNPFDGVKTAVLEIIGVYPKMGTIVSIHLKNGDTQKKVSGVVREVPLDK